MLLVRCWAHTAPYAPRQSDNFEIFVKSARNNMTAAFSLLQWMRLEMLIWSEYRLQKWLRIWFLRNLYRGVLSSSRLSSDVLSLNHPLGIQGSQVPYQRPPVSCNTYHKSGSGAFTYDTYDIIAIYVGAVS